MLNFATLIHRQNHIFSQVKESIFFPFKYKRYRHAELSSQFELVEETIEEVDIETKDNVVRKYYSYFLTCLLQFMS
jgi:hypothetical protein